MSYTIEEINSCTKKIVFNFENVDLASKIKDALQEKQKTVNLKGFRKGKAPLSMVQKVYGPQVENDALYRFVSEEFFKTIRETNLKAVGYPSFSNTKHENDKVSFEATVEIFPEFSLKDYSKYEFKKESDGVSDKDFDDLKNKYLESKAQMNEVKEEGAILSKGHFAVMNFTGETADGEKPDNMKAEEFLLEIGSGQFIPGFEDGMIGMKKGECKTIDVTFPKDYHETNLQNAKVKFTVDLLEIKEKTYPELNDELAKEFGFESVADFNEKNKSRLINQKKREVKSKLQQEILDKLIADNHFDIPNTLIENQKKSVREELKGNLKNQGFNDQMVETYFSKWDKDVTDRALFQVKSGLILDKLASDFNIESTEADLDLKLKEMADESGMKTEDIEKYYKSNENIKNNLMYAIREEKTFDKLISLMNVK